MAQFYTLEEAAQRLNIAPEEFKRKLKTDWTSIRPFRDGATLRFRAADIDELARSLGAASDPGLPLGPVGAGLTESSDDFALAPDPVPTKTGSDSDVRLDLATPSKPAGEGSGPTEEIALDVSGPPSSGILKPASSGKLSPKPSAKGGKDVSSKSGSKLGKDDASKIPSATDADKGTDSSSEFELSLDSDSDSFELQLTSDSSEEMALGSKLGPDDSGRQSGIDLGKPADSGVSLENKKPGQTSDADSDVDFELSLDPTGASGVRLGGPKSGAPRPKPKAEDSSSEFELTLDDSSGNMDSLAASLQQKPEDGKGDIFETDFELPVMQDESGSEVVAVDSDTDLESGGFEVEVSDASDDESASQVVLVDDDDAGVLVSDDEDALGGVSLDDGSSASSALRGVRDDDDGAVRTVIAGPAKWGPVPVIPLMLTLPVAFLGLLMAFELLQTSKGYSSGTKPGGSISRGIADMLGMKIND